MTEIEKALQKTVYRFTEKEGFYGNLLQTLNFRVSERFPVAALTYNKKTEQFTVELNSKDFLKRSDEDKEVILFHELLHFTHNHIARFSELNVSNEYQKCLLIAADLAINCFIKNLPEDAVTVERLNETYKLKLPLKASMEEYFTLLKQVKDKQDKNKDKDGKGDGKKQPGTGKGKRIPELDLDGIENFDEHPWENLTDEEKQGMYKEMKSVIERTMEKSVYSHSEIPQCIKDILEEVNVAIAKLDYKKILRETIKRTLSAVDRENTWNRPNKRYGVFSPGTTVSKLPALDIFIDTSGSISVTETNEFLSVVSEFLKVGARKCKLGFWHTDLYYYKPYKLNAKVNKDQLESGGTDPNPVIQHIVDTDPNLSIILTDGFFSIPHVNVPSNQAILWIVSKNGNKDKAFLDQLPGKYTFMT